MSGEPAANQSAAERAQHAPSASRSRQNSRRFLTQDEVATTLGSHPSSGTQTRTARSRRPSYSKRHADGKLGTSTTVRDRRRGRLVGLGGLVGLVGSWLVYGALGRWSERSASRQAHSVRSVTVVNDLWGQALGNPFESAMRRPNRCDRAGPSKPRLELFGSPACSASMGRDAGSPDQFGVGREIAGTVVTTVRISALKSLWEWTLCRGG